MQSMYGKQNGAVFEEGAGFFVLFSLSTSSLLAKGEVDTDQGCEYA